MPEHSPDEPGNQAPGSRYFPESDFLESPNLATELTEIADVDAANAELLHALDPDQVPEDAIRKKLGPMFWLATGWVVLIVLLALAAPLLESAGMPDPTQRVCPTRECSLQPPMSGYGIMGTDRLSRDIFSRVIWGARVSITVGVAAVVFGIFFGSAIGIVSGFFKGKVQTLLMGMMDILLAFPALLLAMSVVTFMDSKTMWTIILAIGIVAIPPVARLVRASTLIFAEREFVLAARTLGASSGRVIVKEILPNAVLPIVSFGIIGVAVAIVAEGALAFLGLSLPPPTPTWGSMINDGRSVLEQAPWVTLMPCLVLFLTVLSLNLAGDRLREYFDIREGAL